MLYKLSTQIWYSLSSKQRDAASKAVKAVEWLKDFILSSEINSLAFQIQDNFGITIPIEKLATFQAKIKSGLSDFEYNQELKGLAEYIAENNTLEPFDWKQFALGLIQIAYDEAIKGRVKL